MSAATLVGIIAFCSLWTCGSLLRCWKCYGSTYEECQQNLALSNCASESSCFQLNVNFSKANESLILFSKGCLATSNCDDYRRGNAGFCQSERAGGSNGTCFGECCDGEGCNKGDLLALSTTATILCSLLRCWKCYGSTYEECQQNLALSNCASASSCFQLNVNFSNANESVILFSKGCLATSNCDDYRRGNAGFCQSERAGGSNGTCFGECCDGEGCNKGDLLALSTTATASSPTTTQTASNPTTTNKGTVVIISVMVLLSGLVLTVVNIG